MSSTWPGALLLLGTLSNDNGDGDGDPETCEKTGERTPLWREFLNIKQRCRNARFPHRQNFIGLIDNRTLLIIMTSLKDVRDQILISHSEGVLNDDELVLLYDLNRSYNLDLPYDSYADFNFDVLEDDECLAEFRFQKRDLPLLADVLEIPETVECYQRSICSGLEALCILLKRHSYPCRYSDMVARFAKPVPVLCMINNYMIDFIYQSHSHRILEWNDSILDPYLLERYSRAIAAKGSPLDNCFGFIDGTVRPISKPGENQRIVYNGHKRVHGIKFQSVALPNGLIGNMYGPVGKGNYI